jgi:hypothetical protein
MGGQKSGVHGRSSALTRSAEGEIESRASIHFGLRPNGTPVSIDDPAYRGEPDARAVELAARMNTLKRSEELASVLHVEARTVVANIINGFVTVT